MPKDAEPQRPGCSGAWTDPATESAPQAGPAPAQDAPRPLALTEGFEITVCLAHLPKDERTLDKVSDVLWALSAGTRFELASLEPLPGGAKLHFLLRDGGAGTHGVGDDGAEILDLLRRIGTRYRWMNVKRILAGNGSEHAH